VAATSSIRSWVQSLTREGGWWRAAGMVLALLVAVALFSRFSIDGQLSRDESIYVYSGQQLAHGVPPYASIFDPKTPLGSMFAGAAVGIARAAGGDEVHYVRFAFFVFACLTVVAVYALGLALWGSIAGAILSAVTFASFRGFASDALGGPDAKTPAILFAVVSMTLLVRRRWFWGSFAGALAFLVWQPMAIYVLVAALAALATAERGERRRRLGRVAAGAAIPIASVTLYFLIAGALGKFVQAAVTFPLTGIERGPETLHEHFDRIADVVAAGYPRIYVLIWAGLLALPLLAAWRLVRARARPREVLADPLVSVVLASLVPLALYSLHDFQGYPDVYPALPYAAIGIGGVAATALTALGRRPAAHVVTAGALVAAAGLAALSWHWYSTPSGHVRWLVRERATAARIERLLDPGETLYALGDPTVLVLTDRRNPSRFIYLGSGVAAQAAPEAQGGTEGWGRRILASDPAVIVVNDWHGPRRRPLSLVLRKTYDRGFVGGWRVLFKPEVKARAAQRGVAITRAPGA
jgi:4-amino-4-deoxy-L-arabinose transferase-like glycosyltransferase